jgi:cold shock CspA family protein
MRIHGTLTKWNDDRGFGFIEPAASTEELFVHISAFPRDGIRPHIGELVSFETDLRGDGKHRAVRVMRPGSRAASHRPHRSRPSSTRRNPLVAIASVAAIGVIGWYSYTRLAQSSPPSPIQAAFVAPSIPASPAPAFSCDGRTNDLVCRSHLFHQAVPRHENGWRRRRNTLREPMVYGWRGRLAVKEERRPWAPFFIAGAATTG